MKSSLSYLVVTSMLLVMGVASTVFATEGDTLWTRTYGQASSIEQANCIIPSGDGGYLLAGDIYLGAGGYDMYLVKIDEHGDTLWTHRYGCTDYDYAYCLIPSGDGGFLLAGSLYDICLLKVDAQGDSLWSRSYGASAANAIVPSGDGGFIMVGYSYQFIPIEPWSIYSWVVIKVDSQGDTLWSHTYMVTWGNLAGAHSITNSGDGNFMVAGCVLGDICLMKVDAQGDSLWARTYGVGAANSIIPSGDDGFLLAGSGYDDMCVVKVNAQGDSLWKRVYGGEVANSIISTSDGNFLVTGPDSSAMYLVKIDPQGDALWTRSYRGSGNGVANSVLQTADGNYFAAGNIRLNGAEWDDMWLVCIEGPAASVKESPSFQPISFNLTTYPNPFNPITNISYYLPHSSDIQVDIYNLLGQRVETLIQGRQEGGVHSIRWDGSNFSSGIYFARLESQNLTQTQKMLLLK